MGKAEYLVKMFLSILNITGNSDLPVFKC